jgi:predicted HTH transcriptional regulator
MLTQAAVEAMVATGETQTVEFKKSLVQQREGLKALCAMVNSDLARGTVIFGVAPDRTVCGIEPGNLDAAQRTISQGARTKFDPPLAANVEVPSLEGKRLVVLSARRDRRVVLHEYDGRAYIRQGTENVAVTIAARAQLTRRRDRNAHQGPWQCDRCKTVAGILMGVAVTDNGVGKTYSCGCGGEYWPLT